jgi:hypothetical protein
LGKGKCASIHHQERVKDLIIISLLLTGLRGPKLDEDGDELDMLYGEAVEMQYEKLKDTL